MAIHLDNILRVNDPSGFVYYLGTLKPTQIKQLTFVPVVNSSGSEGSEFLNERPENGYQRSGDPKRMLEISEFFSEHNAAVIPPVVLSSRKTWTFKSYGKPPDFGSIEATDLAAIIDGQHRLGGLLKLANHPHATQELKERPIPFMAIDQLPAEQEQEEFIVINDTQKGVKKSLLHFLRREDTFPGQAAMALMEDASSVFKDRIDPQKKNDWTLILFGAAKECIELLFPKSFASVKQFDPYRDDESVRTAAFAMVLEYWEQVSKAFPEQWSDIQLMPPVGCTKTKEMPGTTKFRHRLLEETGIRAFSKLGNELFKRFWNKDKQSPYWAEIVVHLEKLAKSDTVQLVLSKPKMDSRVAEFDKALKSTGKAGVTAIFTYIEDELNKS